MHSLRRNACYDRDTFEEEEERKGLFKSSINDSEVSQKTFFLFMIEFLDLEEACLK